MDLTIHEIRRSALSFDLQFSRLETIIEGLNNAIKHLFGSELSIDWWGTMDEKYECETIYKLAILAYESYITSSISGLFDKHQNLQQFYNLSPDIILVLALAEYITSNTKDCQDIFEGYNLDVNDYPIYNGIKILDKNKDLIQITKVLKSWRNQLIYLKYPVI